MKVQYSDPAGSFLHSNAAKQVDIALRQGRRLGTAELEVGLPKLVRKSITLLFALARYTLLNEVPIGLQLQLPIEPPMALLANKTAEGKLGLRWSKIRLGSGNSAITKTVQVCLAHPRHQPIPESTLVTAINQ